MEELPELAYGRGVEYVEPYNEIEEEEEIIIIGDDYGKSSGSDSKNKSLSTESNKKKSLSTDSKNKSTSSFTYKSTLKSMTFRVSSSANNTYGYNGYITNNYDNYLQFDYSPDIMNGDNNQYINNQYADDEETEILQDLDFTLLGDEEIVDLNINNIDKLISFYKKDREFGYIHNHYKYNNKSIRFLSWNILADGDGYALSSRHNYTPKRFRMWQYRSLRILASIRAYNPDIVALQETTGKMYNEYIKPEFESIGYKTLHSKKDKITTLSDTILFKQRFKLIKYKYLNLGQLSDSFNNDIFGPINNMYRTFLKKKNNHALLTLFVDTANNNQFILVSAHLFWDPDRPQIKAAQMFILNQYLTNLLCNDIEWRLNNINYDDNINNKQDIINKIPIIFACDTNSVPSKLSCFGPDLFTKSGVNEIMYNGNLNKQHLDHPISQYKLRYIRSIQSDDNNEHNPHIVQQQIDMLQSIKTWQLTYNFKWRSVYNEFNKTMESNINNTHNQILYNDDNESIFTNKVPEFCDTIDYIYCNEPIQIQSVLKMPYEKTPKFTSMNDDNFYDQHRYLQQRREDFEEFYKNYQLSLDEMIEIRSRKLDKLLFTGYCRQYLASKIGIKEIPSSIIEIYHLYFCSDDELRNLCNAHDEFINDQCYWRMLYSSSGSKYLFDVILNAWNYPFMPNRKDPSDHFALCCDLQII